MKRLKMAFAGFRHDHILGLYAAVKKRADIALAGAFEREPGARRKAEQKGVLFTYDEYEQMLCDASVDIVAIGDYFAIRAERIVQALRAGKHILTDKPLCVSSAEWQEIFEEADKRGLTVGMILDLRDNPNFAAALEEIGRGTLGKINNIMMEGQHPLLYGIRPDWYFERGKHGGVINDIAIHGVDLARIMTGSDVDRVIGARKWNFYAREAPDFYDSAQFVLKMTSGAGVIGDVSYAAPDTHGYLLPSYWKIRVWGEKGMMTWSALSAGVMIYPLGKEARKLEAKTPEKDYLDRFMDAVRKCDRGYTRDILQSARDTLRVEQAAVTD